MGLFNFLKPKDKIQLRKTILNTEVEKSNILDTKKIISLFQIPKERRDQHWQQVFYNYIRNASLASGIQKIITGPDGFPYFVLQIPEANQPFESYCLQSMKHNILLHQGLGVILNGVDKNTEWVFSHGDIVNLYLNNEFVVATEDAGVQHIDMTKKLQVIKKGDEIMIGQPSERYLPAQTRIVLKKFMQSKGISRPMIMLLCRKVNGTVMQELGLNVHPEDFPSLEQRDYLMQQIGWFLPRHYLMISFSKSSDMMRHFADL